MSKSLLVTVALCAGLGSAGPTWARRAHAGHGAGAVGRRPLAAGLRRGGRGGAPDRRGRPGGRRGRRARREGRRPRQGRPGAGAHRRPRGRTERQRQRGAGAVGARHARRGEQGLRAPEAAVREAVHQPGRARARRVAVQGDAGAGRGAAGAGRRGAHPVGLARRARAVRRRRRRGTGGARRHGDARPAAADAVRPGALRVTAAVPQTAAGAAAAGRSKVEFPGLPRAQRWFAPAPARCRCCRRSTPPRTPCSCASTCRPAQPGVVPGHVRPGLAARAAARRRRAALRARARRSCAAPR